MEARRSSSSEPRAAAGQSPVPPPTSRSRKDRRYVRPSRAGVDDPRDPRTRSCAASLQVHANAAAGASKARLPAFARRSTSSARMIANRETLIENRRPRNRVAGRGHRGFFCGNRTRSRASSSGSGIGVRAPAPGGNSRSCGKRLDERNARSRRAQRPARGAQGRIENPAGAPRGAQHAHRRAAGTARCHREPAAVRRTKVAALREELDARNAVIRRLAGPQRALERPDRPASDAARLIDRQAEIGSVADEGGDAPGVRSGRSFRKCSRRFGAGAALRCRTDPATRPAGASGRPAKTRKRVLHHLQRPSGARRSTFGWR